MINISELYENKVQKLHKHSIKKVPVFKMS